MKVYKDMPSKSLYKQNILSLASIILNISWPLLISRQTENDMDNSERRIHFAAMSTTGLLGLTSLTSAFRKTSGLSPFRIFLVLACVTGHGFLGVSSRKALQSHDKTRAIQYGFYQIILSLFAVVMRRSR